jgi:hypothetical protein
MCYNVFIKYMGGGNIVGRTNSVNDADAGREAKAVVLGE